MKKEILPQYVYRRKKFIKLKAIETLISKAFFFLPNANYCTVFQFKL